MNANKKFSNQLAHNLGLVVIQAQQLESHLKVIVSAMEQPGDSSAVKRLKKVRTHTLGQVVRKFISNVDIIDGNIEDLDEYFRDLLSRRNDVVHHFFQVYRNDLEAGNHKRVLLSLATLYEDLKAATDAFKSVTEEYLDSLAGVPIIES